MYINCKRYPNGSRSEPPARTLFESNKRLFFGQKWYFVFYAHRVLQNIQIDSVIAFKMSNFFKIVVAMGLGLTQVKCRLLNSSIFYAMNFWHFFVRGSRTCIYLSIICYLPACLVPGMTFTEHFILFSFLL